MSEVPTEARCYFDAVNANDARAVAACFTEDAVVIDVDRKIEGREAILHWADDEVLGGVYDILKITPRSNGAEIVLRFAPKGGSSFRARYVFVLAGGMIQSMRLEYA